MSILVLVFQGRVPGALRGRDHSPREGRVGLPGAGVPGMGIPGQRFQQKGPWSWDPSSGHPKNWVRRGGVGEGTQESRMVRERMPEPAPRRGGCQRRRSRSGVPGLGILKEAIPGTGSQGQGRIRGHCPRRSPCRGGPAASDSFGVGIPGCRWPDRGSGRGPAVPAGSVGVGVREQPCRGCCGTGPLKFRLISFDFVLSERVRRSRAGRAGGSAPTHGTAWRGLGVTVAWDGGPLLGDRGVPPARSRGRPGRPGPTGPTNEISAVGGARGATSGLDTPERTLGWRRRRWDPPRPQNSPHPLSSAGSPKQPPQPRTGGAAEVARSSRVPVPACPLRVAPGLVQVGAGGHGGGFG